MGLAGSLAAYIIVIIALCITFRKLDVVYDFITNRIQGEDADE